MSRRAALRLLMAAALAIALSAAGQDTLPAKPVEPWAQFDQTSLSLRGSLWSHSRSLDGETGVGSASAWASGRVRLGEGAKVVYDGWASGDYKRRAQAWTFGIALLVALVFNIDSVFLLRALWSRPALAAGIGSPGAQPEVASLLQQMQVLPVGWTGRHYDTAFDWFAAIAGIFVTAITAVFGAPFWFDALQQLVRLRGTGAKPKVDADRAG